MAMQVFPAQILRLSSPFLLAREFLSPPAHPAMHLVSTLMFPAITGQCSPPPLPHKPEGSFVQRALVRQPVVLVQSHSRGLVGRRSTLTPATSSLLTPTQSAAMSRLEASTKLIPFTPFLAAR